MSEKIESSVIRRDFILLSEKWRNKYKIKESVTVDCNNGTYIKFDYFNGIRYYNAIGEYLYPNEISESLIIYFINSGKINKIKEKLDEIYFDPELERAKQTLNNLLKN